MGEEAKANEMQEIEPKLYRPQNNHVARDDGDDVVQDDVREVDEVLRNQPGLGTPPPAPLDFLRAVRSGFMVLEGGKDVSFSWVARADLPSPPPQQHVGSREGF